jgi:hypothetical protein
MPSSSFFQRSSTTFVSALVLLSSPVYSAAVPGPALQYNLDTSYIGTGFFDNFTFFDKADPTHGFVNYVSGKDAAGLYSASSQSARLSVDSTTKLKAPSSQSDYYGQNGIGRKSLRIESKAQWTYGLFIADINHMPYTRGPAAGCGTWYE